MSDEGSGGGSGDAEGGGEGPALGPELPEDRVLYTIQLWFTPVLVILGTVGNCLCVVVFFGTKLRKLSSSYYLSALAISDTCCLLALAASWLNFVDIAIFNLNGFCQLIVYVKYVCSFLSVWFVVAFTVERFVAVNYPLQRLSVCTVARARAVLGALTAAGLLLFAPYLLISAPVPTPIPGQNATLPICTMRAQWRRLASLLNYADLCLTLVVPVLLIVSLNACIARTVWRLARARRDLSEQEPPQHLNGSARSRSRPRGVARARPPSTSSQTKVTEMLLVVSTVFVALNLPSYVIRVWIFVNETIQGDIHIIILQNYFNLFFDANFGINFVLYCVSGQNFRRALCGMCGYRSRARGDTTMLTVVSECNRTASLNRNRTLGMGSWREAREARELLALNSEPQQRGWIGFSSEAEKTHL